MNAGKFYVRMNLDDGGDLVPAFRLVTGYVAKKGNIRVGIYRVTTAGQSFYKCVDLRDGQELSDGFTLHDTLSKAKPNPTSEIVQDAGLQRDVTQLWQYMITNAESDVVWPSY